MKIGLVLEGGGMRGLYTIGVLDLFMEKDFMPDYVIGVSAGACNAASYLSGQKGRGYAVHADYIDDKRYIGFGNFIKTGSVFGMDLMFDEIPNKLNPFDYDALQNNPCQFIIGVTDMYTGNSVYFDKSHLTPPLAALRASSSIPAFSPPVPYESGLYCDGGTSDPIPVKKAIEDGCDRVIVVLTRDRTYQKNKESFRPFYRRILKKYPNLVSLLDRRHEIYNDSRDYLQTLEKEGRAVVIAPSCPIRISRFEKNMDKLSALHRLGFTDADAAFDQITALCQGGERHD